MSDFDVVQILRARKQHKCEECREPIQVGEKYMRRSGKFDGGMYATKMCLSCKDAYPTWEVLDAYGLQDDDWPTVGDLSVWLHETLGLSEAMQGTQRERIAAMGKMAREYVAQNFITDKWGRLVRKNRRWDQVDVVSEPEPANPNEATKQALKAKASAAKPTTPNPPS